MVTRSDVLALVEAGVAYDDAAARLGINPGLAYMIATGLPADGGDALTAEEHERPGYLDTSTQHLSNPGPVHNPTRHDEVEQWIRRRVERDAQMREAGAKDWPEAPSLGDTGDNADVAELLPRDHNAIHKLASRLKYTPSAEQGATDDQIAERAAVVAAIRDGLERHEAAEAQHFWPFVREKLANGADVAADAQGQEQRGRDVLAAIGQAEPGTKEWDDLAEKLQHALRTHVAYEDQVLGVLRGVTSDEERVAVGERLAHMERSSNGAA